MRLAGDIPARIAALKAEEGPLLQVHGSWQLIQMLLEHGLIDELRLVVMPVIAGGGKRLFASGSAPAQLRRTRHLACENGAVLSFYRRER